MTRRRWPWSLLLVLALSAAGLAPVPAGAAVIFTGNGFDTCQAPPFNTMSVWAHASPYAAMGVYIGGANRACGDGNLSASWVNSVENIGWKLIPTYVGLQAPCAYQSGLAPIDPGNAPGEGAQSADDAVAQAQRFGLGPSTPIYFDMEAYRGSCAGTVLSFLNSWTAEVQRLGYLSGVYGSIASTIANLASMVGQPGFHEPDEVWFAEWNGSPNVDPNGYFADGDWWNHQRLHQFSGGHNESYGGLTLNIDSDYVDGALACVGGAGQPQPPPPPLGTPATWTGPRSLGGGSGPGTVAGDVRTVSPSPTRVDAFWRGVDGNLWTQSYADGCGWGSPWSVGGGPLGSDPHPVSSAAGVIDVFWKGADGAPWHMWNLGRGWNGPVSLGRPAMLGSEPYPVSSSAGAIDLLWRGADSNLWDAIYRPNVGWQAPVSLRGGPLGSDPHVVSPGPGRTAAFWRGGEGNLWSMSNDGSGWRGPRNLGSGPLGSDPQPVSAGGGRLDVFWRGTDGALWHDWYFDATGWHGPQSLGGNGSVAGSPMPTTARPGHIGVVWYGAADANLHWSHYADGIGWTVAASLGGGPLGGAPSPVSSAPGRTDVLWRGADAGIWHMWTFGS